MKYAMTLMLLAVGVGCGVSPPIQGRQDPYARPQITFADDFVQRNTAVGAPTLQRDEAGDLLFVTIPIRSTTERILTVEYRASFFDRQGQLLHQSTWFAKTLEPHVPDQIQVNSLGPRAADFQVDFRNAR